MGAILRIFGMILKGLGKAVVWTGKMLVKGVRFAAPYVVKGVQAIGQLLVKAWPYIVKGAKELGRLAVKAAPHLWHGIRDLLGLCWKIVKTIGKGVIYAVPFLFKKLGKGLANLRDWVQNMVGNLREKRQQRKLAKEKESAQTKTKSKIKSEPTKKNIFAKAKEKIAFVKGKTAVKAMEVTAAIGGLAGTGMAVESVVNSGQYTMPEVALPAIAAGVGTYAIHKIKQKKDARTEETVPHAKKVKLKKGQAKVVELDTRELKKKKLLQQAHQRAA